MTNLPEIPPVITRYAKPSKLDHAPLGTFCHVAHKLEDIFDVYRQVSTQEDDPVWELIGIEAIEKD